MHAPALPLLLGWLLMAMAGATSPTAQETPRSSFPTGQIELTRLIDLAAERLGLRIEYDPGDLRGATVTLRLRDGIPDDELWNATNRLLAARGLAAVQMPGSEILSIAKATDAQARARIEPGNHAVATAGYVSVLYALEHADAKNISEAVRPLLSKPGGAIGPLGSTHLIVLSDYKPRIDTALEVIQRLDVPASDVVFETYDVANLPATQLMGLATSAATTWSTITGEPLGGKLIPLPDGNAVVLVAPVDVANLNKAIDEVRASEARRLQAEGCTVLKHTRRSIAAAAGTYGPSWDPCPPSRPQVPVSLRLAASETAS